MLQETGASADFGGFYTEVLVPLRGCRLACHVKSRVATQTIKKQEGRAETQLSTFFLLRFIIHLIVTIEYTLN